MKPGIVAAVAALLAVQTAGAASAAGNTASEEDKIIARGLELREKGDDEAALVEFRRAYDLSKGGRAQAQMALAEQALGRWLDAESHMIEAMHHDQEPWIARNKRLLAQALDDMQAHLGALQVSGGVTGAEVKVNGERAGTLPMTAPVRVVAGSVALEVTADGYLPVARTVTVPAKGLARETIALVAIPVASKPKNDKSDSDAVAAGTKPEARPHDEPGAVALAGGTAVEPPLFAQKQATAAATPGWSGRRKAGLVLGIAGVAGLGVGAAFQLVREQRAGQFNDAGCTTDMLTSDCQGRYDGVTTARNLAIAGYAGGAVLVGVGAFLFISGGSGEAPAAPPPTTRFARIDACGPAAGGLGLACAGRF